ncbi:MAG TPA: glycoside hydrolase family 9 protein, partial [Ohtaekwangia sp.]|nr:glycoside hydrolase family 9 protein [Ohtaekwangia sp.]
MNFTFTRTCAFIFYTTVCLCGTAGAQEVSKYITVDQFGYLPESQKMAVIRDPQTGFDAAESFSPGDTYALVEKSSGDHVVTGSPVAWKTGTTDASSGDKAWWFDFSSVTTPGTYYVLDVSQNKKSYDFRIAEDVYTIVLREAVRTFFYQRAGFAKDAQFAGTAWADGASHIKPLQDKNARQYNKTGDASTEKDLSGGWYDAGDYNKYTNWTANYVVDFMRAYLEAPEAWGDNYNIPESGNGTPDLLDEAKWGIDHLLRMQQDDGSVLSIVGLSHASPPSAATGPSLYGTASTTATLNTAAAFAIASGVYASIGMNDYATTLKTAAEKAWNWAEENPEVRFYNNDSGSGTSGLGAGQQEPGLGNDADYFYNRDVIKLEAACFLFDVTGETSYRDYFDAHYNEVHLMQWNFAYPFETTNQETLLHYTTLDGATESVVNDIKAVYKNTMNSGAENLPAFTGAKDPYRAHIADYTWGSNSTKSSQGLMFMDIITYNIDPSKEEDARKAAEGFIHYLHGVNPLNMVYLSNMYAYGAENSVNEFYHTWFSNGSAKWDRVGTSTYGPAPGFVTGGPNPSYDWDGCCPSGCGGSNAVCNSEPLSPPKGQPRQKSYKDFNTSWPLNSWSVTENSNGYQLNYIRLLSRFIKTTTIVTGVEDDASSVVVYPNPATGLITIKNHHPGKYQVNIINAAGKSLLRENHTGNAVINISELPSGLYVVVVRQNRRQVSTKILKP